MKIYIGVYLTAFLNQHFQLFFCELRMESQQYPPKNPKIMDFLDAFLRQQTGHESSFLSSPHCWTFFLGNDYSLIFADLLCELRFTPKLLSNKPFHNHSVRAENTKEMHMYITKLFLAKHISHWIYLYWYIKVNIRVLDMLSIDFTTEIYPYFSK